jgi:predicted RNase H-like HicB family nuclease
MNIIKAPNLKLITKTMENKWVAFSANYKKIVAVGSTLAEVYKKAKADNVVVMKALPSNLGYAPKS